MENLALRYRSISAENVDARNNAASEILEAMRKLMKSRLNKVLARYPRRPAVDMEDYEQECAAALFHALDKFYDPKRGSFVNLAITVIDRVATRYLHLLVRHAGMESPTGDTAWMDRQPSDMAPDYASPIGEAVTKFYGYLSVGGGDLRGIAADCLTVFVPESGLPNVYTVAAVSGRYRSTRSLARKLGVVRRLLREYLILSGEVTDARLA